MKESVYLVEGEAARRNGVETMRNSFYCSCSFAAHLCALGKCLNAIQLMFTRQKCHTGQFLGDVYWDLLAIGDNMEIYQGLDKKLVTGDVQMSV